MRRTVLVLSAVAGVAIISGCTGSPERVEGEALPVGAASPTVPVVPTIAVASHSPSVTPPSPSFSSVPPSSSSPSPSQSSSQSSSPTPAKSSSEPKPPTPVLGPAGLGKVKIGMSLQAAVATGELSGTPSAEGCGVAKLTAANAGDASVSFSDRGIVYIPAYGRLATPEGIRVGSTYTQVKNAYSDFNIRAVDAEGGFNGNGTGYGGTKDEYEIVHYRFDFRDNVVAGLGLEHDRQNCYE